MSDATAWPRVPIRDLYEGLFDGPHATPPPASDGPVFLGISNITEDGQLDLSDIRHIDETEFARWTRRVEPRAGDIVFTYEATLNRYAMIPTGFRGCLGRRLALIRPDLTKVDPKFLFYSFFSPDWRATIAQNTLAGSTVERIPLTQFPGFAVTMPPMPIQRRVAEALDAYDTLIANNSQRVTVLEEIARLLYREWFVERRSSGLAHENLVGSEIDPGVGIWRSATLKDVADVQYGFPFSSSRFTTEPIGTQVVRIRDVKSEAASVQTSEVADSRYELVDGDILVGMDGEFHMGRWAGGRAYLNQRVARFRPLDDEPKWWLFLMLEGPIKDLERAIVGTTVAHLSDRDLRTTSVSVPPKVLLDAAKTALEPLYLEELSLRRANRLLRETRNLMLPGLISGTIDPSQLPDPDRVAENSE